LCQAAKTVIGITHFDGRPPPVRKPGGSRRRSQR
jgi:hypothetical protein